MRKQIFVLAVSAIVSALATAPVYAWSYNLEEFIITPNDVSPYSISINGDFVVFRENLYAGSVFCGYDMPANQKFVISPNNIESYSNSNNGSFVVWKDMPNYYLYGYDLSTDQKFIITPNDIPPYDIKLSQNSNYVVWRDSPSSLFYGYDLSARQKFVITPNDVEPSSVGISGDYVVWKQWTGIAWDFCGYNLPARQKFVITPNDVTGPSIRNNGSYVVWKDVTNMNFHGYDLSASQEFIISPNDVQDFSINLSPDSNYVVWLDNIIAAFHGYDLSMKEEFIISGGPPITVDMTSINIAGNFVVWTENAGYGYKLYGYDLLNRQKFMIYPYETTDPLAIHNNGSFAVWRSTSPLYQLYGYDLLTEGLFIICPNDIFSDSLRLSPTSDYVVWKDAYNAVFYGVHIYRVINDECFDACDVEVMENVPYNGSTAGATGDDISSCAYNDAIDVWHIYEPNAGGQITITTDGSDFDTTLSVYNGCGGTELVCNDDYCPDNLQSKVFLSVVKGKKYYIRVAGFDGETGNYQLLVTRGACIEPIKSDLNDDCVVDMRDFAIMASQWLTSNLEM